MSMEMQNANTAQNASKQLFGLYTVEGTDEELTPYYVAFERFLTVVNPRKHKRIDWYLTPVAHGVAAFNIRLPLGDIRELVEAMEPGVLNR